MQNVVGIDIGGSHITLSLVDAHNAEIVRENYIREYVDSLPVKILSFRDGFLQFKN